MWGWEYSFSKHFFLSCLSFSFSLPFFPPFPLFLSFLSSFSLSSFLVLALDFRIIQEFTWTRLWSHLHFLSSMYSSCCYVEVLGSRLWRQISFCHLCQNLLEPFFINGCLQEQPFPWPKCTLCSMGLEEFLALEIRKRHHFAMLFSHKQTLPTHLSLAVSYPLTKYLPLTSQRSQLCRIYVMLTIKANSFQELQCGKCVTSYKPRWLFCPGSHKTEITKASRLLVT